jgi:hypothetical protein
MPSFQAERQLILLSAGTAARRRATRELARQLTADVEWSRLAETLRLRKLLPVLGPRILELVDESPTSSGFAAVVEQGLEAGRRQGAFLQLVSLRVMAMLADAGIRCAPLKGPLLGEAIYGDPGRRLSGDVDLLIAPEQLQAAVEVVRGLGYGAPTDHVQECGLPLLHFLLAHERGDLPPMELHWRVHWYERAFARERLLPPAGAASDWRPAPADELAALLLFYARDGFVDLRLAADLGAWWDVFGADLPAGALDELLCSYPALARVIAAALSVAEKVVGLPAERIVGDARKLSLRERIAVRLANPNPHSSQSQLYADMGLIDGLLAPPGGFGAFVGRQLLPAPEVLDKQAQHGAKHRARTRLARCAGQLARYALAMIRLVRAPEMAS